MHCTTFSIASTTFTWKQFILPASCTSLHMVLSSFPLPNLASPLHHPLFPPNPYSCCSFHWPSSSKPVHFQSSHPFPSIYPSLFLTAPYFPCFAAFSLFLISSLSVVSNSWKLFSPYFLSAICRVENTSLDLQHSESQGWILTQSPSKKNRNNGLGFQHNI